MLRCIRTKPLISKYFKILSEKREYFKIFQNISKFSLRRQNTKDQSKQATHGKYNENAFTLKIVVFCAFCSRVYILALLYILISVLYI